MKDSLRHKLFLYLKTRPNEWINGGTLEDYARTLTHPKRDKATGKIIQVPYKASNASRRLREMEKSGAIQNDKRDSVWYRYIPSRFEIMHQNYKSTGRLYENIL